MTGFIVDAVSQVLRIPKKMIEPPPSIVVAGIDLAYYRRKQTGGEIINFARILQNF